MGMIYDLDAALRKQQPRKPTFVGDEYAAHLCCPCCNKPIVNVWNKAEYKPNYCHYCGQRLDWSDDNDKR